MAGRYQRCNMQLPEAVAAALDSIATRRGMTRTAAAIWAIGIGQAVDMEVCGGRLVVSTPPEKRERYEAVIAAPV